MISIDFWYRFLSINYVWCYLLSLSWTFEVKTRFEYFYVIGPDSVFGQMIEVAEKIIYRLLSINKIDNNR